MNRQKFSNDEYYHIYNRGVDKRVTFLDKVDYFYYLRSLEKFRVLEVAGETVEKVQEERFPEELQTEILVEVVSYCLLPNHYHLILRQVKEGGISDFMKRLGVGYTRYFNTKYERSGVLFQGGFRAKHIATEAYLLSLSRYIHVNPDKTGNAGVIDYPWSSLQFYLNPAKPSLVMLSRRIIEAYFKNPEEYRKFILRPDVNLGKDLIIEDD